MIATAKQSPQSGGTHGCIASPEEEEENGGVRQEAKQPTKRRKRGRGIHDCMANPKSDILRIQANPSLCGLALY
jgi:hypothetical protein